MDKGSRCRSNLYIAKDCTIGQSLFVILKEVGGPAHQLGLIKLREVLRISPHQSSQCWLAQIGNIRNGSLTGSRVCTRLNTTKLRCYLTNRANKTRLVFGAENIPLKLRQIDIGVLGPKCFFRSKNSVLKLRAAHRVDEALRSSGGVYLKGIVWRTDRIRCNLFNRNIKEFSHLSKVFSGGWIIHVPLGSLGDRAERGVSLNFHHSQLGSALGGDELSLNPIAAHIANAPTNRAVLAHRQVKTKAFG